MKDTNYKTDSHTQKSPSSISKIEFLTTRLRKNILKPDGFAGTVYQLLQGERRRAYARLLRKEMKEDFPTFLQPPKPDRRYGKTNDTYASWG